MPLTHLIFILPFEVNNIIPILLPPGRLRFLYLKAYLPEKMSHQIQG